MVFVLGPFLKVWGPYMFKLDADPSERHYFGKFFTYLLPIYCVVSLPLALFSRELIGIISQPTRVPKSIR